MTVISVTRFDGTELMISAELVELMEAVPDTVITLTTGRKLVVREDVAEVARRIKQYRRAVYHGWSDGVQGPTSPAGPSTDD